MTNTFQINRQLIALGIPFVIIFFLVFLTKSPIFNSNPSIFSLAITLDFLLTVPIIYYLLIKKTKIPGTTVVPILIASLMVGTYTLPIENQYYLNLFKTWILPVIEILLLTFIFIKVRISVKKYKQKNQLYRDFFTSLKETCSELIPQKIVPLIATEIAVIYYGFINWKKLTPKENEFTYHKNSGIPVFLGTFIFIIAIETFAMHLLIARWSNTAAWILSGLSVYTSIQILGFLRSLSQRPIRIENDRLIIRHGILAESEIKFNEIESVVLSKSHIEFNNLTKLSPFGILESYNVIIKMNKENVLSGLYGTKKKFTNLAMYIDNGEEFKNKIDAVLSLKTTLYGNKNR